MFGRKNKNEYDNYLNVLKKQHVDVICCRFRNKTRVAGAHLLLQDLLRSKFTLDYYASTKASVEALYLSQEEWTQLAEFSAVLDKALLETWPWYLQILRLITNLTLTIRL